MTMEVNQVYQMDALELLRSLDALSVDAIITDLPYGTTACAWDTIIPFAPMWDAVKHALKPRGVFVTTASQPFTSALVMSNPKWFRCSWVWEKTLATGYLNANRVPMKAHEDIVVFSKQGANYYPQMIEGDPYRATSGAVGGHVRDKTVGGYVTENDGERYPRTVVKFNSVSNPVHPTEKPQDLYEWLLATYTQVGDLVVDPCSGSGTTAAACIVTGRNFIVGDNDAYFCEVTRKRLLHASRQELKAALNGKPYSVPMFAD
jgi:site-specific DNA-methyltransferase (adenine-specific)